MNLPRWLLKFEKNIHTFIAVSVFPYSASIFGVSLCRNYFYRHKECLWVDALLGTLTGLSKYPSLPLITYACFKCMVDEILASLELPRNTHKKTNNTQK